MNNIIKAEELAFSVLSGVLMYQLHLPFAWWLYPIFFLLPDVGAIGYLLNNRIGANVYNLFHFKLLSVVLWLMGLFLHNDYLLFAGYMHLFHISVDRMLGFGLKYPDGFKHTHLGMMR